VPARSTWHGLLRAGTRLTAPASPCIGRRGRSTAAYTFWDLQQQANRLSNALAGLGLKRGDRVGIILPQRPETAIAHIACYQMASWRRRFRSCSVPRRWNNRLQDSGAVAALVRSRVAAQSRQIRDRLPFLRHVIGVAGARESCRGLDRFSRRLRRASLRSETRARPALLIYTSGTTGPRRGAHAAAGAPRNLPASCIRTILFPSGRPVLVACRLGLDGRPDGRAAAVPLPAAPLLGYRGRFDPEKAFWLMQKYGVPTPSSFRPRSR